MKVTHDMYGRAAKCVACHLKWFVPGDNEIPEDVPIIYLSEHPEWLRATGVFVRGGGDEDQGCDETESPLQAPNHNLDFEAEPKSGNAHGRILGANQVPEYSVEYDDDVAREGVTGLGVSSEAIVEKTPDVTPVPIRAKSKKPFDTWEPHRLFCSYQQAFDRLEYRVLAGKEHLLDNEVLEAYRRSLAKVGDKLRKTLERAHESVQRQLIAVENEMGRLTVALRVGEEDLSSFMAHVAALRHSRESLTRLDHNLQAWQQVEDPLLAGGEVEVSLETFDADSFPIEVPSPEVLSDSKPLFIVYGNELRSVMGHRTAIEQRLAEWKRMAEDRLGAGSSVAQGVSETTAELERTTAQIAFLRLRLQQLLADCAYDMDTLHRYRRDILDRDRKGQLKQSAKSALLRDIEDAEANLVRIEAHIRKSLHANSSSEVPAPSSTLLQRLKPKSRRKDAFLQPGGYLMAISFVLPVLLFLSQRETGEINRAVLLPILMTLAQPAALFFRNRSLRVMVGVFLWLILCAMVIALLLSFARYAPLHAGTHLIPYFDAPGIVLVLGFSFFGLVLGTLIYESSFLNSKNKLLLLLSCAIFSGSVPAITYGIAQHNLYRIAEYPAGNDAHPTESSARSDDSSQASPEESSPSPDSGTGERENISAVSTTPNETLETSSKMEGEGSSSAVQAPENGTVLFSLAGVIHGEGISPRFRASLNHPDGAEELLTLRLGQPILGEWKTSEYNSESKKLTITNGNKLLLLGAGDSVPLDDISQSEAVPPDKRVP